MKKVQPAPLDEIIALMVGAIRKPDRLEWYVPKIISAILSLPDNTSNNDVMDRLQELAWDLDHFEANEAERLRCGFMDAASTVKEIENALRDLERFGVCAP